MQFEDDPFSSKTTETGNRISDEIAEAHQKKWQTLIETEYTHNSRKTWKTINKLPKDYAQPHQQCKGIADHVAHQLLLNDKGNATHRPSKAKITNNHITLHSLTSPFTMKKLMKGIKIMNNNKAACLGDMLCEQIKHLGPKAMVWLRAMISILKPGKESSLPKSYRPNSLLCYTYTFFERIILNPITGHTSIKEQAGLELDNHVQANC